MMRAVLIFVAISLPLTVTVVFSQDAEFLREQQEWRGKIGANYQAWLRETDVKKKGEMEATMTWAIMHRLFDHYELLDQFAANGKFTEGEIKLPAKAETVILQQIKGLGANEERGIDYNYGRAWVIRRMTKNNFEIWSPKQGWLFNANGELLNTAKVPRKDGNGRQWYGAFLSDGSWVTTDIWDMDCQLHFYSRAGRWLRSVTSQSLVDAGANRGKLLIYWCRADASGKWYMLSVDDTVEWEPKVWSYRNGKVAALQNYRQKCYPRDLEPKSKLGFVEHVTANDSGDMILERGEASHGSGVGHPSYSVGGVINGGIWNSNASSFGFWPDSDDTYINAQNDYSLPEDGSNRRRGNMCWFFHANGEFAAWVKAVRLADANDEESMLFDAGNGKVVTISDEFKVTKARQFRWADGSAALPEKIFPDLNLGFFWQGKELVLARWR